MKREVDRQWSCWFCSVAEAIRSGGVAIESPISG